ncbi:helicase SNF [Brevibacillus reuszeri]|uniref:Helicase SNF n=1 Tax=Brevibacillus reuszeri TaxID=54915 RepID=A0A0K9YVB1_9BACL|nr:DEAD/DEAH box helicase [Brevibacillus reuszeri]KNB72633.1 helicase SNF [Brevibacillus reuszeri]MED1860675.1 DEAD/DEAH box helicase [Brevibacillus reuszeri]GED70342.1 helicase SNF [Brevibacillus reuszeri]
MSFTLSEQVIKTLCGRISYEKGKAYYRTRKVAVTHFEPQGLAVEATVNAGNSKYEVQIDIDGSSIEAACTCPTLRSYNHYCQHVAAVLLQLKEMLRDQSASYAMPSRYDRNGETALVGSQSRDTVLTKEVLGLFEAKSLRPSSSPSVLHDTRICLEVEFSCKIYSYGYRKRMFGIELKVGGKRLYIVKKVREFLERLSKREIFVFSNHFTYDPQLHRFQKEDDAVLQQLIRIYQNENVYLETTTRFPTGPSSMSGERMLLVPPASWDSLLPALLAASSVQIEKEDSQFVPLEMFEGAIPVQYTFDQAENGSYQLDVQGLDAITIMESYQVLLIEGKLFRVSAEQCERLAGMKQLLDQHRRKSIPISSEQMETFMVQVVPGLMNLGGVQIARSVSDRIVQTKLKAKLFLDRVRDRLLAGLEFQYGDIIVNPLEQHQQQRGTDLILMRDGEKERKILEIMERSAFSKTEAGFFLQDEEAEYDFLYHVVPELEKLVSVYATTAVKIRLHTGQMAPKVMVDVKERTNWLELSFELDGIPETEIRQLIKSLEEKRKYHKLPNGALLPLEADAFQEMSDFIDEMGIHSRDLQGAHMRLPMVRGLHMLDTHKQGKAIQLGKSFRQMLDHMRNPDHLDFPVPDSLEPIMRDYQKFGFQWLKTLAHYRFGGILADDMGLGKTLQSIAFLVSVLPEIRNKERPALVVSPASLVYNWRNELKKFAPQLRTVIVDGNKAQRKKLLENTSEADVIITSYPLLRIDHEQYADQLFHTLILDEAQAFKNHTTQTAHAVKRIQAQYRFALTGTPVENRLEELWSIYDAVFPELFPSRKAFHDLSRDVVAKRARPFLLRRVKSDVLKELPEKIESLQASELLSEQKKLYVAYLAQLQQETLKHLQDNSFDKNRIKILAGLTRLRQICCHPALFVENYEGSSAKFEQLLEIMEECRSARKRVLVFSQFTRMLGLIGRELGYSGVPFFYLDGSTPAAERVELCNRFNNGERDLFLMSLKAGGTGLNLTGADTVILYDLWWNPAVEQQAADRAHRIGQKKVVQVIRLVAQSTVEEKMYELQQKKKNLVEEVIQPGQEALSALTEQEIREMLMI